MESIQEFETTYINNPTHGAQETFMFYNCLMNPLSKAGKKKVLVWEKDYKIGDMVSGNLLLKVIIRESHLDTNTTTLSIRTHLSSLETYIIKIGSDITEFNGYMKFLIATLNA